MTFGFHYWYFWHLAIAHSMEDPGSTPLVVRKLLPGQAIMLLVSSAYKMLRFLQDILNRLVGCCSICC